MLGSGCRQRLHRRPGRLPAPDDAQHFHLERLDFERRGDVPVDLVVEALDGIVAAAEVEVLAAHDQNVDFLGEVAVEDVRVAAVREHFFDLVGGGVGGGHDGFLLSFLVILGFEGGS